MTTAALYSDYRPGRGPVPRPTVGLELYPPRSADPAAGIWQRIDRLVAAAPNYVSVTYGAGGRTNRASFGVLERIAQRGGVPSIAHLTCIGQTESELENVVAGLITAGVRNFLAIRGDLPEAATAPTPPREGSSAAAPAAPAAARNIEDPGPAAVPVNPAPASARPEPTPPTPPTPPTTTTTNTTNTAPLTRAAQLVRIIRRVAAELLPAGVGSGPGGSGIRTANDPRDYVSIAVAYYPASAGRARENDIAALLEKQQAGADYGISQVFYDPAQYESYLREATFAGVRIPLVAGIIPLTDIKRLNRLQELTGVAVPEQLRQTLIQTDSRTRISEGLKATLELCERTLAAGAPGLHVFSFNRPRPALDVLSYIQGGGLLDRGRPSPTDDEYWRLIDSALAGIAPLS